MAQQLRGEQLKALIREGIVKLATLSGTSKYVYSAVELSKQIGVSRPTLAKYEEYIDEVLKDIAADKKITKGTALIDFMRGQVERLEAEKTQLKKDVDALRANHVKIYQSLYYRSIDLAPMVKKVVIDETKSTGKCILCNHKLDDVVYAPTNNVVKLEVGKTKAAAGKNKVK